MGDGGGLGGGGFGGGGFGGGLGGSFMGGLGEGLDLQMPSFGAGDMPEMGAPSGGDAGGSSGGMPGPGSPGSPGGSMGGGMSSALTPGAMGGGPSLSGMGQHHFGSGAIPTTPPSTGQAGPMGSVTGKGNMPAPAMLASSPGTGQRLMQRGGGGMAPGGNRMAGGMPPAGNIPPPGGGRLPPAGNIPPPTPPPQRPGPPMPPATAPPPMRMAGSTPIGGPSSPSFAAGSGERNSFGPSDQAPGTSGGDIPPQFGQQSDADRPTMDAEARHGRGSGRPGRYAQGGRGGGGGRAGAVRDRTQAAPGVPYTQNQPNYNTKWSGPGRGEPQAMRANQDKPMMTGYTPGKGDPKVEGGPMGYDPPGPEGTQLLNRAEDVKAGRADYVSVAGRPDQYGLRGTLGDLNIGGKDFGDMPFRVEDKGDPALFGTGRSHFDVAHGGNPNANVSANVGYSGGDWNTQQIQSAVRGDPSDKRFARATWPGGPAGPSPSQAMTAQRARGGGIPPPPTGSPGGLPPGFAARSPAPGVPPPMGGEAAPFGGAARPPSPGVPPPPPQGPPPAPPGAFAGSSDRMGAPSANAPYRTAPQRFQPPPGQQPIPGAGRYAVPGWGQGGGGAPPPMTPSGPPGRTAGGPPPMQPTGAPPAVPPARPPAPPPTASPSQGGGTPMPQMPTSPPPTPSPVTTGTGAGPGSQSQSMDPLLQGRQGAQPSPGGPPPQQAMPQAPAAAPPAPPAGGGPPPSPGVPPQAQPQARAQPAPARPQLQPRPAQPRPQGAPPRGGQMPQQMTGQQMHQRMMANNPNASHEQRLNIMNQNRHMLDPASRQKLDQINQMRQRDFYPGGPNTGQNPYIGPMYSQPIRSSELSGGSSPTSRSARSATGSAPRSQRTGAPPQPPEGRRAVAAEAPPTKANAGATPQQQIQDSEDKLNSGIANQGYVKPGTTVYDENGAYRFTGEKNGWRHVQENAPEGFHKKESSPSRSRKSRSTRSGTGEGGQSGRQRGGGRGKGGNLLQQIGKSLMQGSKGGSRGGAPRHTRIRVRRHPRGFQ